jgi:hypothetical protein
LVSPAADVLMAGGASLLLFAILKLTVPKTADTSALAAALYYAAFLLLKKLLAVLGDFAAACAGILPRERRLLLENAIILV